MTDLETAIAVQFDTDETARLVQYYRQHLDGRPVADRLSRHLENTTHQRIEACADRLVADIAGHSLLDVDWFAIASEFLATPLPPEPPADFDPRPTVRERTKQLFQG
jgi:hypothetical protein